MKFTTLQRRVQELEQKLAVVAKREAIEIQLEVPRVDPDIEREGVTHIYYADAGVQRLVVVTPEDEGQREECDARVQALRARLERDTVLCLAPRGAHIAAYALRRNEPVRAQVQAVLEALANADPALTVADLLVGDTQATLAARAILAG